MLHIYYVEYRIYNVSVVDMIFACNSIIMENKIVRISEKTTYIAF